MGKDRSGHIFEGSGQMTVTILRGGNVLDLEEGILKEGCDIAIEAGRIMEVSEKSIAYEADRVIDISGKTVMPGMIDCHVHVLASMADLGRNAAQTNVLAAIRALPILKAMLSWDLHQSVTPEVPTGA